MRRALGVGILLFATRLAFADCASPTTFLVPESGALPTNAVLYVFASAYAPPVKSLDIVRVRKDLAKDAAGFTAIGVYDAAGTWLDASVSAQPSSDAFQVFRVEVSAPDTTALVVRLNEREYHYTVGQGAATAGRGAVRITGNSSKSYAWTCSHHATRDLAVTPAAPLYRVSWAATEDAVRAGQTEAVLLPHRAIELAYRWKKDEPVPEDALLQLGHLNCTGETLSWKRGAIWASIVAIYPDGTETPASDPVRLEPPGPPEDRER